MSQRSLPISHALMGVDLNDHKLNNHEAGIAVYLPSESGKIGDMMPAGIVRKARVVATAWAFVWRVYVKSGDLAGR